MNLQSECLVELYLKLNICMLESRDTVVTIEKLEGIMLRYSKGTMYFAGKCLIELEVIKTSFSKT